LGKKKKELREQALKAERRGDAARERALSAFASAREKALAAEAKAARLRKQARLLQKRRRALWEREKQNIDELEVDEAAAEAVAQATPSARLSEPASSPTRFS
jgi:hypothetical protein